MNNVQLLLKQLEQEKLAHKETKQALEKKSAELFYAHQELRDLATTLSDEGVHANVMIEAVAEGVVAFNGQGVLTAYNRTMKILFDYQNNELSHCNLQKLLKKPEDFDPHNRNFLSVLLSQKTIPQECIGIRKDGSEFPVEITITDAKLKQETLYVALLRDITVRKQNEARLTHLVQHDYLTDLPNKALFEITLDKAIARAKRAKKHVAVLYLDLDHFKKINDTLGHEIGDLLLREVAIRLTRSVREGDTVARLGGDEFAIVLEDLIQPSDASNVAQNILDSLTTHFLLSGHNVLVSTSIGIALFPQDGDIGKVLIKNSDMAMYNAKALGRQNFQFFTLKLNEQNLFHYSLESSLHHAIKLKEMFLCYQPQLNLNSQGIVSIEVLLRWQNPTFGPIAPDTFIPMAEKLGLILPIGEWVLRTAFGRFKTWQTAKLLPQHTKLALNLSKYQLVQENILETISQLLHEFNVTPEDIELEIAESSIMMNHKNLIEILKKLQIIGVNIAIDDFGTGYSCLEQFKYLPIHSLKIDKIFISGLATEPRDVMLVKSIISLGHALGLIVVAEGVETAEQLTMLRAFHCDRVQGYHFSAPLRDEEMAHFLQATSHPNSH